MKSLAEFVKAKKKGSGTDPGRLRSKSGSSTDGYPQD